jgi:hypothetical protein
MGLFLMRLNNSSAVDLLLKIIETRSGKISGSFLRANHTTASDALLKAGLLSIVGSTNVVPSMDDYEDEPTTVVWSPEHGSHGYFNANGKWMPIAQDEINLYGVKMETFFARALVNCERVSAASDASLVKEGLWDLGLFRLEGRRKPVSVWFSRRIFDPTHRAEIEQTMRKRPPADVRIVLTSTARDIDIDVTGQVIVVFKHVLAAQNDIAIDPAILSKTLNVAPASVQRRLKHSIDYGQIYIGDEVYNFPGVVHRAILKVLVEAYNKNDPVCLTAAVLQEAEAGKTTTNLARAFSKNKHWNKFIKEKAGQCWIEF